MDGSHASYEAASGVDPFQILTAEHALIRLQLSRALDEVRRDAGGANAGLALAVLLDALRLHQRREDLVMYPVCERLFGGKDGAASVLQDDHAEIRRLFETLLAERARSGRVSVAALVGLRALLEAHFVREERVLFPLMTAHLAGREAADLARRLRATSPT